MNEHRILFSDCHEPGAVIRFRTAKYDVAPDGSYRRPGRVRLNKKDRRAAARLARRRAA